MADLVDAAETAAPAPPLTKAPSPGSMRTVSIDDTPTEPATSPRVIEVPVHQWQEDKPRCQYRDWNREHREEEQREKEAHERSIQEWQAQVDGQRLIDHAGIPCGPPPKETSSMRVLPNVHAALRQNDPSVAPGSQPVLKKAPPSTGWPMPKRFYSDKEPPRIGTAPVQPPPPSTPRPWEVQPQEASLLKAPTPMTPGNPPRPPLDALPKPMPMKSSMTSKHPVESSSQQGPPKQARHKPFPFSQPPPGSTSYYITFSG